MPIIFLNYKKNGNLNIKMKCIFILNLQFVCFYKSRKNNYNRNLRLSKMKVGGHFKIMSAANCLFAF